MQTGDCGIAGGISLVDLVTSFERIASHCANISLHIVKRVDNNKGFDEMHGHTNDSHSEEYKALYHYYETLYVTPVINEKQALQAEIKYRNQPEEQNSQIKLVENTLDEKTSKKDNDKATKKKSEDKKTDNLKSDDKKPDSKKSDDKKPDNKKSDDKKPDNKKSGDKKQIDKKIKDKKTDDKSGKNK